MTDSEAYSSERRRWPRRPVLLPALYYINNYSSRYRCCTITGISRAGATILLPGFEFFKEDACCSLDVMVPRTARQLTLRGRVRIRKRQRCGLVAGIQCGIAFDAPLPRGALEQLADARPLRGWHSVLQKQIDYGPPGPCAAP